MARVLYITLTMATLYHASTLPINEEVRILPVGGPIPYEVNTLTNQNQFNKTDFQKSLSYIDKTVRQVELLLNSNSSLPRLTRGEILEIIENITKTDLQAAHQHKTNERGQKAVMLVMPFTPNQNDDGKIQDLYTKAPVTQIVGDTKPFSAKPTTNERSQLRKEGNFRGEVFVEPLRKNSSIPNNKPSPDQNQPVPNIKEEQVFGVATAEVRPDSYVQFKPLPDISGASEEMEEFLERFGLGKSAKNSRKQKKIVNPQEVLSESPNISFEMLPDTLIDVAQNLGLVNGDESKKFERKTLIKPPAAVKKEDKKHVFNPMETPYTTQEELDKLNQLMDIIKQLEKLNGTATEEDLNKLNFEHLKELVGSLQKDDSLALDKYNWAPNPLNDDDFGGIKNDVKRQEGSTTASTTEATSTTAITRAQESETVNIRDLEDSFGGSAGQEVTVTIPPPSEAPKTGFYYLLDWNTFLDIDDQKGKRVNLRFQPKAGDPSQFISVSVP